MRGLEISHDGDSTWTANLNLESVNYTVHSTSLDGLLMEVCDLPTVETAQVQQIASPDDFIEIGIVINILGAKSDA